MLPLLPLALALAGPASSARIESADHAISWWLPDGWTQEIPKGDPNVVLQARRADGTSIRLAPAPFPNDSLELKEKARRWADRLRTKGYPLSPSPQQSAFGRDGMKLVYFRLDEERPAIHGFFATAQGTYYLRTSNLLPKELLDLLASIEVRKRAMRAYESIWPDAPIKTILSRDGAFGAQVLEPWTLDEPSANPRDKTVLSIHYGQAFLTVTATDVPATPKGLRSAAEAALAAALQEGAEGGPVEFLVLRNGLLSYFIGLRWPKAKDIGGQIGAFFSYGGRSYSVAAVNFAFPVLKELLGSIEAPPPERAEEARRMAETWGKAGTPNPNAPKPPPSKVRSPGSIAEPSHGLGQLGADVLMLVSAALGVLGSWLYFSEASAELESGLPAAGRGAAPVEEPVKPSWPETGPLRIRRRYLAAASIYEVDGPEGRRFVVESHRSLWVLRWTSFFLYLSLWSWAKILHIEAWPSVGFLKFASLLTCVLTLPAEFLFGRRARLLAADRRTLVLEAHRDSMGLREEYVLVDTEGKETARLRRRLSDRLGAKRWTLLTPSPEKEPVLVIEGDAQPWFRKAAGHLFGLLRDDLTLRLPDGTLVGQHVRHGSPLDQGLLDFDAGATSYVSTDVLALAVAAVHILDPDRWHPWPFG
jgi:hypothetical protein